MNPHSLCAAISALRPIALAEHLGHAHSERVSINTTGTESCEIKIEITATSASKRVVAPPTVRDGARP
jgi:hypothetical protein